MEVLEYFVCERREHWLHQIEKSDWRAGRYLYELLRDRRLKELCGEGTEVLLLVEDDSLISFCTFAEQDDVRAPELTPWVGFVYTFPEYRGRRRAGRLLEHAYGLAQHEGYEHIYISTCEQGLYEKYGYSYWRIMKDLEGEDSRVYRIDVSNKCCS